MCSRSHLWNKNIYNYIFARSRWPPSPLAVAVQFLCLFTVKGDDSLIGVLVACKSRWWQNNHSTKPSVGFFFFFLIFGRCLYSVTFDALYLEYYGINLFFSIKIPWYLNLILSKSLPITKFNSFLNNLYFFSCALKYCLPIKYLF